MEASRRAERERERERCVNTREKEQQHYCWEMLVTERRRIVISDHLCIMNDAAN